MSRPDAPRSRPLDARAILRFYLPLVLNAWLLALVGPVLNLALARGPEPRVQLAAFWIAFGILLSCQSACLVLQQATASHLVRRNAVGSLALPAALAGLAASALVLAIARTPLGDAVLGGLVPVTARTATLARAVLLWTSPVPLLVAVRGVANGIAVAARRTGLLTLATVLRVALLAAVTATIAGGGLEGGALTAARALLAGAALEAAFMVAATLAGQPSPARTERESAAAGLAACAPVLRAALPLAVAALVWNATRPAVSAVLGHLADRELAQAGFGVLVPVLMVSCAPLWALLEVALVLPRDPADVRTVLRFAAAVATAFAAVIAAATLTPLRAHLPWARIAATPELLRLVAPALGVIALEPLVLSARAVAQGLLLRAGGADALLWIAPLRLVATVAAGAACVALVPAANGAVLAAALLVGGDGLDALWTGLAAGRALACAAALPPAAALEAADAPLLERAA